MKTNSSLLFYYYVFCFLFVDCYLEVAKNGESYRGDQTQNNAGCVSLSVVTIVPNVLETDQHNPQG